MIQKTVKMSCKQGKIGIKIYIFIVTSMIRNNVNIHLKKTKFQRDF